MSTNPHILIIDDDKFFLEFYKAELSQFNMKVDFAVDGEEGLAKVAELKPDIILLDVILPVKDGFEVLAQIKQNEETKNIPVFVISSLDSEKDTDKLKQLGASAVFNKIKQLPKDVAEFINTFLNQGDTASQESIPQPESTGDSATSLSSEQINKIFSESLSKVEESIVKLFDKKPKLEDMKVTIIAASTLSAQITELSQQPGTVFIYSPIRASSPGLAIMSIKRDDTLDLIKFLEKSATKDKIGLDMSDRVIEELFNIIINGFLTQMSGSISGQLILEPPALIDKAHMSNLLEKMGLPEDNLVVYLEESYQIESLGLGFKLFVTFGSQLFKQEKEK
jgi:CheY-like chemotaxis protein